MNLLYFVQTTDYVNWLFHEFIKMGKGSARLVFHRNKQNLDDLPLLLHKTNRFHVAVSGKNKNVAHETIAQSLTDQMKIWSSHLLDNLSNCLMNLKNSGDSTGFEPMSSAMPVQCSNQLSYEVTQLRAGQFVGFMFSRERNVVWKIHLTFLSVSLNDVPTTLFYHFVGNDKAWLPVTSAIFSTWSRKSRWNLTQYWKLPT